MATTRATTRGRGRTDAPNATGWFGASRRDPPRSSSTWVVRHALAGWLRSHAADIAARAPVRVLDVGCGGKPYYPYFADIASVYTGVDACDGGGVDIVAHAEDLPIDDASYDVVLCTQVLEHCREPWRVVRELRRVTAPGGRVLASTHGVQVYHPSPNDYYRWTHEGLRLLFEQNGPWSALTVTPGAGTASTLAMLAGIYTESALRRTPLARGPVWLFNTLAATLETRSVRLREPVPGSLIANLHVTGFA